MTDQAGSAGAGNPGDGAGSAGAGAGGAGAGAAGAGAGGGTGTQPPWYGADVPADIKGFLEVKGWDKDPLGPVKGYQQLETLLGADKAGRAIVLPKDAADKAGWDAIYTKLGRPAKADEYQLPVPEGDSGEFAKTFAPILHEAGLTRQQAVTLATKWNEYQKGQLAELDGKAAQMAEQEQTALKVEWGAQHDAQVAIGQRAAQAVGIDADSLNAIESALGYQKTMKLFAAIGSKIGEDSFTAGDGKGGAKPRTVEAARVRLQQLQQDTDWVKRYVDGGTAERAEKDELDQIIAAASSRAA